MRRVPRTFLVERMIREVPPLAAYGSFQRAGDPDSRISSNALRTA